jgi:hypothetical protein
LLKEWADLVLFCNYKIHIVEGTDGKLKAQGGKERTMYAERSAAWDAKNRFGLPEEMPMEISGLLPIFAGQAPRNTTPAPAPTAKPSPVAQPAPAKITFALSYQIDAIKAGHDANAELIAAVMERENAASLDELTYQVAKELLEEMKSSDKIIFPDKIAKWLAANSEKVTAYLVSIKWLTEGQIYSDLSQENAAKIIDRTAKFARAAGLKFEEAA